MAQVNGEAPSSAFFSHLCSYPVISDSISTFKSHPIGQKSIDLSTTSYEKIGKPLIPYLSKPYSTLSPYVTPYLSKADSVGDLTLSKIDSKFPVIKKPTGQLYTDGKSFVFFPITKGKEGKDYVSNLYHTERKGHDNEGFVGVGKAVLATGFVVSSDALYWLGQFLSKKKAEVKEVTNEKLNQ